MKALVLSLSLLVLIGGVAVAQTQKGTGSSTGGAAMKGGAMPEAPVGHRQPRAGDIPTEGNANDSNDSLGKQMNKENAALDRKLKSICRGC